MTSDEGVQREVFVWIWLPGRTRPVVAGKLTGDGERVLFVYGRSYLDNPDAIPIHDVELPLRGGAHERLYGTERMPGCIRDAAPDSWGRRVILNRLTGAKGGTADLGAIDEFTYLMESGSDRAGGLDFQESPVAYAPREADRATLDDLLSVAELVERGERLPPALEAAAIHGTAIGGARPKAMVEDEGHGGKYIAKFSKSDDIFNMVKAEYVAMRLAAVCGLTVADVALEAASGRDVLLVERFDRAKGGGPGGGGWTRRLMLSALTLLDLDEMTPHYASYEKFAEVVRQRFTEPKATLHELFGRMVFNILSGNTDDHARNHAAFWDGSRLALTPAYDICPLPRSGGEASQAMMVAGGDRSSRLTTCLAAARNFQLDESGARRIIDGQLEAIRTNLDPLCDEAGLSPKDRELLKGRAFLNPYALEGFGQLT